MADGKPMRGLFGIDGLDSAGRRIDRRARHWRVRPCTTGCRRGPSSRHAARRRRRPRSCARATSLRDRTPRCGGPDWRSCRRCRRHRPRRRPACRPATAPSHGSRPACRSRRSSSSVAASKNCTLLAVLAVTIRRGPPGGCWSLRSWCLGDPERRVEAEFALRLLARHRAVVLGDIIDAGRAFGHGEKGRVRRGIDMQAARLRSALRSRCRDHRAGRSAARCRRCPAFSSPHFPARSRRSAPGRSDDPRSAVPSPGA